MAYIPPFIPPLPDTSLYPIVVVRKLRSFLNPGDTLRIVLEGNVKSKEITVTLDDYPVQFIPLRFSESDLDTDLVYVHVYKDNKEIYGRWSVTRPRDHQPLLKRYVTIEASGYKVVVNIYAYSVDDIDQYAYGVSPEDLPKAVYLLYTINGDNRVIVPILRQLPNEFVPYYEIMLFNSNGEIVGYWFGTAEDLEREIEDGTLSLSPKLYRTTFALDMRVKASSADEARFKANTMLYQSIGGQAYWEVTSVEHIGDNTYRIFVNITMIHGVGFIPIPILILIGIGAVCGTAVAVTWMLTQRDVQVEQEKTKREEMVRKWSYEMAKLQYDMEKLIIMSNLAPQQKVQLLSQTNQTVKAIIEHTKRVKEVESERDYWKSLFDTLKWAAIIAVFVAIVGFLLKR